MASISPRKNKKGIITSYTIRVYHGYDSNGKRLKSYTTSYMLFYKQNDKKLKWLDLA